MKTKTDELWSTMAARDLVAVDRTNYQRICRERDELAAALKNLHRWINDLSIQTDSSANYNLEKLHRGHCTEYNKARAALANTEAKK